MLVSVTKDNKLDVLKMFLEKRLETLECDLNSLDYDEDIDGNLVYSPYGDDSMKLMVKREMGFVKNMLEIIKFDKDYTLVTDLRFTAGNLYGRRFAQK